MQLIIVKDLPRYECLLEASREFPDLDPSATEAFLHLLRTGDEAFRLVETHLAKYSITQGGFGVLMALWGQCRRATLEDCLTPADLAERTGVTRATMTGLIDTLAGDGLVTRQPHAKDRRKMSVTLTAAGRKLLAEVLPQHFRHMAWLLEPLSEAERKTFVGLMTKVMLRAAEFPATSGSPSSTAVVACPLGSKSHA